MSQPAEKLKINRTRKRIYETQQEDAPETESLLQDPVAEIAAPPLDMAAETVEAVIQDAGSPSASVEPVAQEPVVERELSAMEIAALEFAAESAAHDALTAEAPEHTEMEEPFRSAMATVYRYSALSAATGLIPVPLVDMAGFMAMQLMMLKRLCALYNIPFDTQRSKSAIAILASGISSTYLGASSAKLIPFLGAFSIAAMPAVNGAFSYAVGRVFIQHFASGGTFLDFDPDKVRGYFDEQFRVGKLNRSGK
ncbi:MAG TPA: DUF697 domain-containing protein [Desulfuromonadales bacterium]|nr:DUF697 domain-containing protein [Desulfuromonadales bacterium]